MASYRTTIDLADRMGPYLKMGLEQYAPKAPEWDGWTIEGDIFTYNGNAGYTSTWLYEVAHVAYVDAFANKAPGHKVDRAKAAMYDALYDMASRMQSLPVWCVKVERVFAEDELTDTDDNLVAALERGVEAGAFIRFDPAA